MTPTRLDLRCPNGHRVTPANLSCMKAAGWYWCGHCILDPEMISMAGGPIKGAFYSPLKIHSFCDDCHAWTPPEGDNTAPDGRNVCSECAMAYIGKAA